MVGDLNIVNVDTKRWAGYRCLVFHQYMIRRGEGGRIFSSRST